MKKDEPDAVNSATTHQQQQQQRQQQHPHIEARVSDARSAVCSSSTQPTLYPSLSTLQFFVRMISGGNTLVIHANSQDSVKSVHDRIQAITGIPLTEQRLIYCGKQLQLDKSLAEYRIQNDAGLQLVGRMRSTQACKVVDEMVSLICRKCRGEKVPLKKCIKSMLTEFLTMTQVNDSGQAAGHLRLFMSSGAPAALVMLYMSPIKGSKKCAYESIIQFINSSRNVLPKHIHSLCAPIVLEFCKLLGRASHDDPLYILCRNSLGSIVGRMQSTYHPQAWQVVDEMVSLICRKCRGEKVPLKKCIKSMLTEFLTMTQVNDSEQAAGHLQIFMSSCAPAALVMLYMSPIEGNKKCADESIRQFINSSRNVLPKHIHSLCAPIVLEFCKLLGRASHDDPLYILCRNSLGSIVGRMQSTYHPQAWQVVDEMVSLICRKCRGEKVPLKKCIKSMLTEFLTMTQVNDSEQAAGHLQIFMSSCAPAALVMLYMSPIEGNKKCADESIRQFINSSRNVLPKHIHSLCAPIVLEFCKLLGRASHDDPLYILCRNSLGSIVENMGMWADLKTSDSNKALIAVQEIFPFVSELAAKISHDLDSSVESITSAGPSLCDVRDFTAFLLPLRITILDQVGLGRPITMPLCEGAYNVTCEEIKFLFTIFVNLLEKMDMCLQRLEVFVAEKQKGEDESLHLGWAEYLTILKELNNIAKLYQGAEEEFWTKLRHRKASLCYLVMKYAKRTDDHRWIIEHKEVTTFESRRHLAMMMLPEVKDEDEELHEMLLDRSQLLAESYEYIGSADPEALRGGLFLEFKNEEATGPGVLREWFFLVCQAIFNPQNALFLACPNDRRRFFPNPASKVETLYKEYFRFSGRVIALALMHKVQVGIVFDRVFFVQLAGMMVTLEDIRDADPYLYSSCKQILEMDPETVDQDALALTFVTEVEELGTRKVEELCRNGKFTAVNSKNRREYVDLLIQHHFVTSVREQVDEFTQGFTDIISSSRLQKSFFQSLELEDLDWMLHGSESPISVDDWKAHTEYNGYSETDPQIFWFWKIVGEMSVEQRKVLLFFWTSVKYLPIEGFGGLTSKLYIYKSTESCDRLPSSHTCFYRLCFPSYPSMEIMQNRLRLITQEHVGCSFGTW